MKLYFLSMVIALTSVNAEAQYQNLLSTQFLLNETEGGNFEYDGEKDVYIPKNASEFNTHTEKDGSKVYYSTGQSLKDGVPYGYMKFNKNSLIQIRAKSTKTGGVKQQYIEYGENRKIKSLTECENTESDSPRNLRNLSEKLFDQNSCSYYDKEFCEKLVAFDEKYEEESNKCSDLNSKLTDIYKGKKKEFDSGYAKMKEGAKNAKSLSNYSREKISKKKIDSFTTGARFNKHGAPDKTWEGSVQAFFDSNVCRLMLKGEVFVEEKQSDLVDGDSAVIREGGNAGPGR